MGGGGLVFIFDTLPINIYIKSSMRVRLFFFSGYKESYNFVVTLLKIDKMKVNWPQIDLTTHLLCCHLSLPDNRKLLRKCWWAPPTCLQPFYSLNCLYYFTYWLFLTPLQVPTVLKSDSTKGHPHSPSILHLMANTSRSEQDETPSGLTITRLLQEPLPRLLCSPSWTFLNDLNAPG